MRKIILFAILIGFVLASCRNGYELRPGDLLFCVADASAMSDAIVDVTKKDNHSAQYDHVGIYAEVEGKASVIEALPKRGVVCRSLQEFLADACDINEGKGVVVMRLTIDSVDIAAAINRALKSVGLEYDWTYMPDNSKMYCTELVYESFLNDTGGHIFKAQPMSFRDENGVMPDFWVKLFDKLGEPIPEGILGTNPNDMSQSPFLKEVHRYFHSI